MKIGVVNMPGRFNFGGQCIRTRFFILGLPLFPTSCFYKISNNLGIEVPLTGQDILHAYAKFHFGVLGFIGLMWSSTMSRAFGGTKSVWVVLSLAMLAFSIYSWAKHHSASDSETLRRRIFGKAFMYNMLPEHLPVKVQESLYTELNKVYFGRFQKTDWQGDIKRGAVTKSNFHVLYTLAYYQKTLAPSEQSEALFKEIETFLDLEKELKTDTASNTSTQTNTSTTQDTAQQSTTNSSTTSGAKMTMEEAMRIFDEIQEQETASSQPKTAGATQQNSFSQSANQSTESAADTSDGQPEKMSSGDVVKLHNARGRMNKQLLMLLGFFGFGTVMAGFLTGSVSSMLIPFMIVVVLVGVIAAFVFGPEYVKISKDLSNREKIKVKVRVKDLSDEMGTAYLVLRQNQYGIKKITAPSSYYSTDLLNKELEIYVSKASHVLLDIVGVRY